MRISCKKLAKLIRESKIVEKENPFSDKDIREKCEAFGRDVQCYFQVKDMKTRKKLENFLEENKVTITREYSPGTPCLEIAVAYFKAWHWDI